MSEFTVVFQNFSKIHDNTISLKSGLSFWPAPLATYMYIQIKQQLHLAFLLTHISLASFSGRYANSADSDQTPQKAASDQVRHCLLTEFTFKFFEWNCQVLPNNS